LKSHIRIKIPFPPIEKNARQERSAPARPLCEEQPMADGQGVQFILFNSTLGR